MEQARRHMLVQATPTPSVPYKAAIATGVTALNAMLYLVPNHFPLREATAAPFTAADLAIPFVQSSVWVYLSDYALVASAFMVSTTFAEVRRFVRACVVMLLIGAAIHLLWPTELSRAPFPIVGEGLTSDVFRLLRRFDMPTSCFPSMHVAGAFFAALSLWQHSPRQFRLWLLWAAAVAISTLTTKQHVLIDVAGGILLALGIWWLFYRRPGPSAAA